jgi:hypothetical protein
MPIRTVPGFDLSYYLVCLDGSGAERLDDPDGVNGRILPRITGVLKREPFTDVFLMSHGWMGDVPAAIRQYDRWIGAMATCKDDLARLRQVRAGFKPLLIGVHWPSLPYGDEEMAPGSGASFSTNGVGDAAGPDTSTLIDAYADRIAGTPAARKALETIFAAAAIDTAPPELSREVADAYRVLNREVGLGAGGAADAPGQDREPFNPDAAYQTALEESEVSFGSFGLGPVLSILQSLSFFKMKDRARMIGETSVHTLLAALQNAGKQSGHDVRFHLMGHSFGCIVMSAALAGPPGRATADPVHSAFLAQGAVSFWSYCTDIPQAKGSPGYFRSIIDAKRVTGVLATTQSEHDTAVCKMYPMAAGARGDVAFEPGEFPRYGALGAFGARGPGVNAVDLKMLDSNQCYNFEPGKIYNIESSTYIAKMQSLGSGAHNDIAHPEVAHAMWSAVLL